MAIWHLAIAILAIGPLAIGILAIRHLAMGNLAIGHLAIGILAINVYWQSMIFNAKINWSLSCYFLTADVCKPYWWSFSLSASVANPMAY